MMKVILGIVSRGNDIHYKLLMWVVETIIKYKDTYEIELVVQPSPHSARFGQEKLFNYAYERKVDWLVILDSDVIPPKESLPAMVTPIRGVIVAPIWFYDPNEKDIHLNIHLWDDDSYRMHYTKPTGVERIRHASFGYMSVPYAVLEAFKANSEAFTA